MLIENRVLLFYTEIMKINFLQIGMPICLLFFAACAPPKATPEITMTSEYFTAEEEENFTRLRNMMVDMTIVSRGVKDEAVLQAMRSVPRHQFVPKDKLPMAYNDHPLPIGYGQTISQPYIVAWMTELVEIQPGDKVLEIGTGSGYQAAILAEMGNIGVYSIEIIPELAEEAAQRLKRLGYDSVKLKQGDGYYGWEEYAPYDAIIVTAAPDHLPQPLVQQLKIGGKLVIPIGPPGGYQSLWLFVKEADESVKGYNQGGVAFVPLTGSGVLSQKTKSP